MVWLDSEPDTHERATASAEGRGCTAFGGRKSADRPRGRQSGFSRGTRLKVTEKGTDHFTISSGKRMKWSVPFSVTAIRCWRPSACAGWHRFAAPRTPASPPPKAVQPRPVALKSDATNIPVGVQKLQRHWIPAFAGMTMKRERRCCGNIGRTKQNTDRSPCFAFWEPRKREPTRTFIDRELPAACARRRAGGRVFEAGGCRAECRFALIASYWHNPTYKAP